MDDKLYIYVKHIYIYVYYYIRSEESVLILTLEVYEDLKLSMCLYYIHFHV
jgi:hypothetical protein